MQNSHRTSRGPGAPPTGRLDLESFLVELKRESQPPLYIPNPGNAGDSMIGHATRQLFDRVGLDYQWLRNYRRCDPRGRVVIYAGGGNLIPLYSNAARALRWAHGRARRVVLLPHTVVGHEELLAELGPETDLICREETSYEHAQGAVRSARCHLADDLAFSMDVGQAMETGRKSLPAPLADAGWAVNRVLPRQWRRAAASPGKLRRAARMIAERRAGGSASDVLHTFRTDYERTDLPIPPDNLDLSNFFDYGTWHPDLCHTGAGHLLRYIDLYDEVQTNRLHVAIGAALLGKRVEFHANSYFKNRAVYEFSIRDRFPDVKWMDAPAGAEAPRRTTRS